MKTILRILLLVLSFHWAQSQITTPAIKANFGVDGELQCNYFYNFRQSGNDDWFKNPMALPGSGDFVIDTTGAAAIVAQYAIDPVFRQLPFFRTMRYPPYSLMNNKRIIDAVFIRDYHGDDSTVYSSGNKNGMSPANWNCPVSQSVPDKNEILDMFVHVRREGPSLTDSLWMFGGLSIENTTGNRYFDFEMYQTDIYYDRPSRKFYGYGPNAGHTIWQFNAAGDITVPGDIIFTAEYSTSSITAVEARIWVDQAALSMTPQDFNWTGTFDGASNSSQYGYAGIMPKTAGAFYTGLTSLSNTWAGPFSLIRSDNSVVTNYTANQFMEFSVNLTKIGLDPVNLLGGNGCGMPFRRILVKSRASTSFSAELKDFVGPFDFFLAPRAIAAADITFFCGANFGISNMQVSNPISTSVYTWSTTDGHILSTSPDGTSAVADAAGTYVVSQQLQSSCSVYATDTVVITFDANCSLLPVNLVDFRGTLRNENLADINWSVTSNQGLKDFILERSTDGFHFNTIATISPNSDINNTSYKMTDDLSNIGTYNVYYRVKTRDANGSTKTSKLITLTLKANNVLKALITPNPVKDATQINIYAPSDRDIHLFIYDNTGRLMQTMSAHVVKGSSVISLSGFENWATGIYPVKISSGNEILTNRLVVTK